MISDSLQRGHISMGSIRTWSLALIAGIFVVVVAHQRSNADAGAAGAGRPRPRRQLAADAGAARRRG